MRRPFDPYNTTERESVRTSFFFAPIHPTAYDARHFLGVIQVGCGLFLAAMCLLGLAFGASAPEGLFLCFFFGLPLGLTLGAIISGCANFSGWRLRALVWLVGLPLLTALLAVAIAPPISSLIR
jgi:hypothetical protein